MGRILGHCFKAQPANSCGQSTIIDKIKLSAHLICTTTRHLPFADDVMICHKFDDVIRMYPGGQEKYLKMASGSGVDGHNRKVRD